METVRVLEMPPCRMVTSGAGMFGEPGFDRFSAWLDRQPRSMEARDYLIGADAGGEFKFEWLYLYSDGMDTEDFRVIDFPGGIYAVITGIDAASNESEMAEIEAFIARSGFAHDETRGQLGRIIGTEETKKGLGYDQMDYFVPVKLK